MKIIDGPEVIALLSGDMSGEERNVRCPRCGDDYTHVVRVGTLMGTDPQEASIYSGTQEIGKSRERRSAVAIEMHCEPCGPEWPFSLVIQQHKGVCYVQFHVPE